MVRQVSRCILGQQHADPRDAEFHFRDFGSCVVCFGRKVVTYASSAGALKMTPPTVVLFGPDGRTKAAYRRFSCERFSIRPERGALCLNICSFVCAVVKQNRTFTFGFTGKMTWRGVTACSSVKKGSRRPITSLPRLRLAASTSLQGTVDLKSSGRSSARARRFFFPTFDFQPTLTKRNSFGSPIMASISIKARTPGVTRRRLRVAVRKPLTS